MNLIRWITSTLLSALLLPQILGIGSDAKAAPMPPELQEQLSQLAAQVEEQGAQVTTTHGSFLVIATDDVLGLLQDGLEGLQPIVEVVNQVKNATSGPAVLPPGVRLARVTFELAVPKGGHRAD